MAGMLPGVEAARRRRFHRSNLDHGVGDGSTRRASFCLYVSNYNELHISSQLERKAIRKGEFEDEKLGEAAREAKKRLDHKLQTHWKSDIKRSQGREKQSTTVEEQSRLQTNV